MRKADAGSLIHIAWATKQQIDSSREAIRVIEARAAAMLARDPIKVILSSDFHEKLFE
jgi:hypothetical protein